MLTQSLLQKITSVQRKSLIDHVEAGGTIAFRPADGPMIGRMCGMKLVRYIDGGRSTTLTVLGREAACAVLAEYAEALIRAGAGHSPLEHLLTAQSRAERAEEMKKLINIGLEKSGHLPQATENIAETPDRAISAQ